MGLVCYLACFLPQLAEQTWILTTLTTKEAKLNFDWTVQHKTTFETTKALVVSSNCLMVIDHYSPALCLDKKFCQRGFGWNLLIQAGFTLNFMEVPNFQDLASFITLQVHSFLIPLLFLLKYLSCSSLVTVAVWGKQLQTVIYTFVLLGITLIQLFRGPWFIYISTIPHSTSLNISSCVFDPPCHLLLFVFSSLIYTSLGFKNE